MSDVDVEFDFENDTDNEAETETETKVDRRKGKRVKHPIPTGWETPSDLAIRIEYEGSLGEDAHGNTIVLDPTYIYSLGKNEKNEFPAKDHTDGRLICDTALSIKWLQERRSDLLDRAKRRAEREANRGLIKMRSLTKAVAFLADENR